MGSLAGLVMLMSCLTLGNRQAAAAVACDGGDGREQDAGDCHESLFPEHRPTENGAWQVFLNHA